jgi:hypothetical protein
MKLWLHGKSEKVYHNRNGVLLSPIYLKVVESKKFVASIGFEEPHQPQNINGNLDQLLKTMEIQLHATTQNICSTNK